MSVQSGPLTVAPRFALYECSFRHEDTYSGGRFASSKPRGTAAATRLASPPFDEMSHSVEAPRPANLPQLRETARSGCLKFDETGQP